MSFRSLLLFLITIGLLSSCNPDNAKQVDSSSKKTIDNIDIRLPNDPKNFHPIFNPNSVGREVFQYIFLSLADLNPENLALTPVLIKEIPEGYESDKDGEKWINYQIEILPEATWSDGTAITAKDYLYTINMICHPMSNSDRWRKYLIPIKSVRLNPNNPKRFTISFDKEYHEALDIAVAINLLPAHIYDKTGKISALNAVELLNEDYKESDEEIKESIELVNKSASATTDVVQNGPYRMTSYASEQYVILERVKDYWGSAYPENPFLQSNPDKITFKVVPDEMTAITMAKENKLDLMKMSQSTAFLDMKNDDNHNKNWSFHVPQLNRYYYISLNNKSEILSDKTVRRALAHLADVDDYIENIDGGLGTRTIGHFHPAKDNYNTSLSPIPYDIDKANALLDQAGWTMGPDKIRTKVIDGKATKMEFDIIRTGSRLSELIALLYQEATAKAGIKLNIVNKNSALMRKENLATYNYDILLASASLESDDPYNKWHSDNATNGMANNSGYSSKEADFLIEKIRSTTVKEDRDKLCKDLQVTMHKDQPVVFLYSPLSKIIINSRLAATTTSKRPGYQANTFELAL